MSLTFTEVPPVSVGQAITSTQHNKIADGFNSRLRPNAGDSCERIVYSLFTLFRQPRNPGDLLLFPPQSEFFSAGYQLLNPGDGEWPAEAPGDPEGANLACFINAFVFGNDAIALDSEDLRIADEASGGVPLFYSGSVPSTPEDIWMLGKQQRGAYDPGTGAIGSPSFFAANEHYRIHASDLSPHGNTYGGFMPVPETGDACSDPIIPNWQIFFTSLIDSSIAPGYPKGTCPENGGDVAAVVKSALYYHVYFFDGSLQLLPLSDWIEGPYTGGSYVRKQFGDQIPRVLNAFAMDFRGTEAERATQTAWLQYAFDTQRFLTSQYHLAPNIGTEGEGGITAEYPLYYKAVTPGTTLPDGTLLEHTQSGTTQHAYAAGFVLASAFVKGVKVASGTLEFLDGSTVLKSVPLAPDGSGNVAAIVTFDNPITPAALKVRCAGDVIFVDATGTLSVETSELMEYKPLTHDLYLVLRLAACRSSTSGGLDGSGTNEDDANEISDSYFANGCILNHHGHAGPAGTAAEVNTNAVYDSARRLSKRVRIMPRQQFDSYEVTGGKSICYFKRYATLMGVDIDMFEGIAPNQVASGAVKEGIVYKVWGETAVTYNGTSHAVGTTFTGVAGVTEFTADDAEEVAVVYEYDGIRATAPREGWSNEWLMGTQLKVYNDNEESIWKPDAYSDYNFWSERCHFYHGLVGYGQDIRNQFNYGENVALNPETFTGWRYVHNTNNWDCGAPEDEGYDDCVERRRDRYKSCRIYEPLPEIESATLESIGPTSVLKLTFKTRFHHHEDAPATIARDVALWTDSPGAESYRTMENGLREYLLYQYDGTHCHGGAWDVGQHNLGMQGNSAYFRNSDTDVWSIADAPKGACFPHFYFLKLFEKVRDDTNNTQDAWDTPLMADWWITADWYLRAMCEGFVDGLTSTTVACSTGMNSLFCYTYEALHFEAHGGKSLNTLATETTSRLGTDAVREDAPWGFGQLQNTSASSEIYNQLAACLNKLTKVQIMLPQQFQIRVLEGHTTTTVTPTWTRSEDGETCGVAQPRAYYTGVPPEPGVSATTGWFDSTTVNSDASGSIVCDDCAEDGDSYILRGDRVDQEWRWALVDPDALNALPEVWQTLFYDDGDGRPALQASRALGIHTIIEERVSVETVVDIGDSSHCGEDINRQDGYWNVDGGGYLKFTIYTAETSNTCEIISNSGTLHTNWVGASTFAIGRDVVGNSCCGAVQRGETITPLLGDDTAFVEIPLV